MNKDDDEVTACSSFEKVVLDLLDQDISENPERLHPVTDELVRRIQALVHGVSVNLGVPLPPEDMRYST